MQLFVFRRKSLDAVLESAAQRVAMSDKIAFTRRVMWQDLNNRIESKFKECLESPYTQVFGGFNFTQKKYSEPIRSSKLGSFEHLNSTHISSGLRLLRIFVERKANTVGNDLSNSEILEHCYERNCQLWYSQSSSGKVRVFLAPYASNAGEIEEKNIIIGSYSEPASISYRDIEKHMSVFIKYCACTSHNNVSFNTYLYRKYLVYKDFRFRAQYRGAILSMAERMLIVGIPAVALWFTIF